MTITEVRAVPYFVMKDYLDGNPVNSITIASERYDKTWIISVTNADDTKYKTPVLIPQDREDAIALAFDDVEPKLHYGWGEVCNEKYTYFTNDMARKVVDFVNRAHSNPDSNDLLVVNCHMGVSRSGAISDFVRTVCRIDFQRWKRSNQTVNPNRHVLELLTAAWSDGKELSREE